MANGNGVVPHQNVFDHEPYPPLRRDPASLFQALKCRIEGAMLDEQLFFRRLLDGAGNPLSVLRSEDQCAEDQKVQRALCAGW
jgi:hypothetical protein